MSFREIPPSHIRTVQVDNGAQLLWRSFRIASSSAWIAEQILYFTAGEQHFFHDKNFKNEPKRCKGCKTKRQGSSASGFTKTETMTTCSQCGRETTVPFKPTQGRPVYCRECFLSRKATGAAVGNQLEHSSDSYARGAGGLACPYCRNYFTASQARNRPSGSTSSQ